MKIKENEDLLVFYMELIKMKSLLENVVALTEFNNLLFKILAKMEQEWLTSDDEVVINNFFNEYERIVNINDFESFKAGLPAELFSEVMKVIIQESISFMIRNFLKKTIQKTFIVIKEHFFNDNPVVVLKKDDKVEVSITQSLRIVHHIGETQEYQKIIGENNLFYERFRFFSDY